MFVGGKCLEVGVEEGDRTAVEEGDVGEVVLQEAKDAAVDIATDGQFHVGGFEVELFHDIDSMVKQLILGVEMATVA